LEHTSQSIIKHIFISPTISEVTFSDFVVVVYPRASIPTLYKKD